MVLPDTTRPTGQKALPVVAERCPRCTGPLRCGGVLEPALSRFDNMTKVCSDCGSDEAVFYAEHGQVPDFRYVLYGHIAAEKGGL